MQEMDDMTDEKLHPTINFLSPLILHWGVSQLSLGEGKFCPQRLSLLFHHRLNDWTTHIHTSWQQAARKQKVPTEETWVAENKSKMYCHHNIKMHNILYKSQRTAWTAINNIQSTIYSWFAWQCIWQIGWSLTTREGYRLWRCCWLRLVAVKSWHNGSRNKRKNVLRGH